jgi:hypothetical protein
MSEYTQAIRVGDATFIYFPSDCGGRLIPADHIKSIVPDFKGDGSMIFLTNTDKAVKVQQNPKAIAHDLHNKTKVR